MENKELQLRFLSYWLRATTSGHVVSVFIKVTLLARAGSGFFLVHLCAAEIRMLFSASVGHLSCLHLCVLILLKRSHGFSLQMGESSYN